MSKDLAGTISAMSFTFLSVLPGLFLSDSARILNYRVQSLHFEVKALPWYNLRVVFNDLMKSLKTTRKLYQGKLYLCVPSLVVLP